MIKKTLMLMFALLLMVSAAVTLADKQPDTSVAEPALDELFELDGIILERQENALLIRRQDGSSIRVMLIAPVSLPEELMPGDYCHVVYNGMMSRSEPAIVEALELRSDRVRGTVTGRTEEGLQLMTAEGQLYTIRTEQDYPSGSVLTVYSDDASADTIVPTYIRGPEYSGIITGVTETGILLEKDGTETEVLVNEDTLCLVPL